MGVRTPTVCVGLLFAAMLLGSVIPYVGAQAFLTIPAPETPGQNQVLDFYAGGTSDSYTLRISPQGGTLSVNDYLSIGLMPWGYVTTQWPTGRVYIFFLVNATATNFRIGFLYLTNSTNEPFILRWYDYASNNIQVWTFQGVQHVYNRTVTASPAVIPKLTIPAAAKVTNGLSALGPQLYLTSTSGTWLNGTTALTIYPLYNQYFTGANDYNEVWSLLVDGVGNYYFAILYMQNSDASHVIVEHQLRLNDYLRLNGTTVNARWRLGDFVNQVTVRTGVPNLKVTVDGFPFQANQKGILSISVPGGALTLQVPAEIPGSNNEKLTFSDWGKFGKSNPLRVVMNSTLDITAKYTNQYALNVNSPYGAPQGSGWYSAGANATFSVNNRTLDFGNGTRRVFLQWNGDSNSTTPEGWLIMDSGKQVAAEWKSQYTLSISAPGLPANATTSVRVGDQSITLAGPTPVTEWVDANQQLTITVQNQHVQAPTGNYSFSELRADNQTFGGVVVVTQPITIWLMYSASPSSTPAIGLKSDQAPAAVTIKSDVASIFLSNGLMLGRNIPQLTPMISLTATLAKFGYLLAAFIVPGGSPIAGYLLGSLFVGLIYVLPVSAVALFYRSAKTKRQPNLKTLTPLAIVWAISLALIFLSSSVAALQSLVATLQILLMLTTMLLFPLVIAFRMAKLAA